MFPALVMFTLIVYYPLVKSLSFAFTDYYQLRPTYDFIGFKNFIDMVSDNFIRAGVFNTFKIGLFALIFANALSLLLAIILNMGLKTRGLMRAIFYIPCLISPIVISGIFGYILQYNGLLNSILAKLGLNSLIIDWFTNIPTALPMILGVHTWQWVGFSAVIYLAGLQSIPVDCIEAATIDGANKVQIFFRVTLPLLMPAITINTFLCITGGLKLFELPFVLTHGGPANATETIGMAIYEIAFNQSKLGYASALSIVFLLIVALISITQIAITRRREVEL
jgi:ABC-type sugar transport system permease subunit